MPEKNKSGDGRGRAKRSTTSVSRKQAPKREAVLASASAPLIAGDSEQHTQGLLVVALGASAGGLEAIEKFFAAVPDHCGMAFVVITHMAPDQTSMLPDLVQRATTMSVVPITDGMPVARGRVHVIPPDRSVTIQGGILHLSQRMPSVYYRPIDTFFRHLGEDQHDLAVGIVLSGTGSDGSEGLKAIKAHLGLVMAQEPSTARYSGMPEAAIGTGLVDFVLPPDRMPEQLVRYAERMWKSRIQIAPAVLDDSDALRQVFGILRNKTGHDLSAYKSNTVVRRIQRRMHLHDIPDMSLYVRYLREHLPEVHALFKELFIGVTSFFRDPESFEILRQKVLPLLLDDKRDDESVRLWVPGVATGEEAYSIAMLIREYMEERHRHFNVQVFAADINAEAIQMARTGVYQAGIASNVGPERLKRFFARENDGYRIRREIRDLLIFAVQDVIRDPPFTKLDLICCRNLLIYLNAELQRKVLPLFHYSLKPGGVLFLGSSESIGEFSDLFAPIDIKWKIYQRKESAAVRVVEFPLLASPRAPRELSERGQEMALADRVEKSLLKRYAPPCVITNKDGGILYIFGRTGKYLEPPMGRADWNIMEMAREGLKLQLPGAFRRALNKQEEVRREHLQIQGEDAIHTVNMSVRPMREHESLEGLMMVVFEEVAPALPVPAGTQDSPNDVFFEELKRELVYTKESLQSSIEELETSNEELKSMNEEYQSTNEELKSANEELETSREELQSLNEELATVNMELQEKVERLSKTHREMQLLLDSLDMPTLFLDNVLQVRRFTVQASNIINLIATDVGRPLAHIASNIKDDDTVEKAQRVRESLQRSEELVQSKDGHWYLRRIVPDRTAENAIQGVVVNFVDINQIQNSMHDLGHIGHDLACAQALMDTASQPLLALDEDLRIVAINAAGAELFETRSQDVLGRVIDSLGDGYWPRLRRLLPEILRDTESLQSFPVDWAAPKGGQKRMELLARYVRLHGSETKRLLLALEEQGNSRGGTS